jgi:glycosyltransferase involved in cell wall biosynthesis
MRKNTAVFIFAEATSFSGQHEASRLIYDNLDPDEWEVKLVKTPAVKGPLRSLPAIARYASRLAGAWARCLALGMGNRAVFNFNMGQTHASFLREGVPLLIHSFRWGPNRMSLSLHGNNFMTWRPGSLKYRVLAFLAGRVAVISVLSERQRSRLMAMGVKSRVVVVRNTCAAIPCSVDFVRRKQDAATPLRLLHLSNLIESKGFKRFVEAIEILAREDLASIDAVLCGVHVYSQFGADTLGGASGVANWLEAAMERINRSRNVRLRWVRGAQGDAKWQLFRECHVFVFPSNYPVEAQPIVLIESLAHGAAIITSFAGEIEEMVSDVCLELKSCTSDAVVEEIRYLIANQERRLKLALDGRAIFQERFSNEAYMGMWKSLLRELVRY